MTCYYIDVLLNLDYVERDVRLLCSLHHVIVRHLS